MILENEQYPPDVTILPSCDLQKILAYVTAKIIIIVIMLSVYLRFQFDFSGSKHAI